MKILKAFERAGLSEEQAEDATAAIGEAVGENVATKADLHVLELRLSKQLWATAAGIVTANAAVMLRPLRLLR